ncbi:MAG: RNA polymerase sigma factor [Anaerolineae bacterium]|nr:RNA polymerase sigma factor [Anaerolineae bacterium]
MAQRSNEQWLDDLTREDDPLRQSEALADLTRRLQRGIFYYLSRERSDMTSRSYGELEQMAEDFAQEATLRVLKNLHSFRGDSLFTTWATKVAVRVAISELRRARYKDFSLEALTGDGEVMPDLSDSFGTERPVGPERSAEQQDVIGKIEQAIQEALTERQRAALVAVGLQGVPLEVVAERMDTNRNALYKLLHDARSKLKATLEHDGISMEYVLKLFERS